MHILYFCVLLAANLEETRMTPDPMEVSPAQDAFPSSQDTFSSSQDMLPSPTPQGILYVNASILSPISGVHSDIPAYSPAYSNIPTPQSVSSTASENPEVR